MISIQTNVNSLVAQENLGVNNKFQAKTIQQLTSGYRINSSGDDAAGLAVANKFRNDVSELSQGVANGNDAVAQLQIVDGGMSNISSILDRLKTLATQSGSASFTGDRKVLNDEFQTDITEINRQAQAIGLNTGGSFAKSLDIYLGGGKGPSAAAVLSNGTVNVDLSKATVDAQSLGLKGLQAVTTGYDLGSTSATSVAKILGDVLNVTATPNVSKFVFTGPGFGDAKGVTIDVNLNQVTDTKSLITNINAAIKAQETTGAAGFTAANITASMNTDATGKQQLSFNSSTAAFQVTSGAGDLMAGALMGSLTGTLGAATSQIAGGSTELATAGANGTANAVKNLDWTDMVTGDSQLISFSAVDASGKAHSVDVTLSEATAGGGMTIGQALTAINTKLQQSNDSTMQQITAVATSATSLNFISTLAGFTVSAGVPANGGAPATTGITNQTAGTADTLQALQVGTGSSADISTLQGATNAVSAVSAAVGALGTAQAAIGKGQNQLGYAISLATSQITNFSAAASQIRDTDVAQQAANLTKAQVLQQASIAAMAQANSAPQAVLSLLKG